jgi:predicted homoserine dehydrogenase-like protein
MAIQSAGTVMNYDSIFGEHAGLTVRADLLGAGQFGASFVGQMVRTPILDISVACDLDP